MKKIMNGKSTIIAKKPSTSPTAEALPMNLKNDWKPFNPHRAPS